MSVVAAVRAFLTDSSEYSGLQRLDRREKELWLFSAFVVMGSLVFFLLVLAPIDTPQSISPTFLYEAHHYARLLTLLLGIFGFYVFRTQRQLGKLRQRVWKAELEREVLRKNVQLAHNLLKSNHSMFEAETERAGIAEVVTEVAMLVLPVEQAAVFSYEGQPNEVAQAGTPDVRPESIVEYAKSVRNSDAPVQTEESGRHVCVVGLGPEQNRNGALVLIGKQALEPGETEQAQVIAKNLTLAWEMSELRQNQGRQQAVLESVNGISLAVVSCVDLKSTLTFVLEKSMATLHADAGAVLLAADHGGLHFAVARGAAAGRLVGLNTARGQGIAGRVFESRRGVRIDRKKASLEFDRSVDELTEYSTNSVLAAPLCTGEETVGVIELLMSGDTHEFTDSDLILLQAIANQAALLIRHARLVESEMRARREWEITFDAIADSILVHDAKSVVSRLNGSAAQLFGGQRADLLGMPVPQLLEQRGWPHDGCIFCNAASEPDSMEELTIASRTFLLSTASVPSAQAPAVLHVLRDISEHKRLQRALNEREEPRPVRPNGSLRILVVDGDEQRRQKASRTLINAGYKVETAPDPDRALSWIRPGGYDVVLYDWYAPGLSAKEFYQRGVLCDATRQWIFMTREGESSQELAEVARQQNVWLITAPFGNQDLLRLLSQAAGQSPQGAAHA